MARITATVEDRHVETLDGIDAESQAEAVRWCIEEYARAQQLDVELQQLRSERDAAVKQAREEYETRIEDLERELERAKRERRQILEQREEHNELVRAVEREQSLAERRAEAGFLTKTKWALFGMKTDD